MARSAEQIAVNIATAMLDANPMTDVTKGPFYDVAIVPPANEIASAEAEADRVSTLYSRFADRPGALADGEIAAIGRAFKVATPVGRKAKVLLTFYLTSLPTTSIDIPAGVAVGSADGVFVFVTTTSVTRIDASTAATRLDAGSGRYLFNVEAEAVAVGGAYNLPAYRITKLLTPIPGVAGVYNAVASSGGSSPDRSSSYLASVQDAFLSRDTSSISGLAVDIARRGISQDIRIVDSTQRDAFTRPVRGSAVDVYMINPGADTAEDVFAANNENEYQLLKKPVLGIDAVYINGVVLGSSSYTFVPDTSPAYRRSAVANDRVRLAVEVASGDVVRIRYTYASAPWSLQTSYAESDVMGVDVLARLTNPYYVTIAADIVCPASSLSSVSSALQAFLLTKFGTTYHSSDATAYLQSVFPEVQLIRWTTFNRRGQTGVDTLHVPFGFNLALKSSSDLQLRTVGV